MDMANEGQPVREQIYPKFMRAVQRNQSVFAHHAQRSQLVELVTPGGLFAGYAYGIQLPTQQITKELATIVQGLYYAYIGKNIGATLPETTPFEVFRQRDMDGVIQNIRMLLYMGEVLYPLVQVRCLSVPMDGQQKSQMSVFGTSISISVLFFPLLRTGAEHWGITDNCYVRCVSDQEPGTLLDF